MLKNVNLNKNNIDYFYNLNLYREKFNILNKDFFKIYNNSNFAEQILMRRRVKLLTLNNDLIGHIWYENKGCGVYFINAFNIIKDEIEHSHYKLLLSNIRRYKEIHYECINNSINSSVLPNLGFKKSEGIVELVLHLDEVKINEEKICKDISFSRLIKGEEEDIRCDIQNEVFYNKDRTPLTVEDIYYDSSQQHYIEEAAIFIRKNQCYIGYGQIIYDETLPYIVNLGIRNKYRGCYYGYTLLLELVKIAESLGFKKLYINVESENIVAINLYKSIGFKVNKERFIWVLKKAVE